jgi:hypothetical protein
VWSSICGIHCTLSRLWFCSWYPFLWLSLRPSPPPLPSHYSPVASPSSMFSSLSHFLGHGSTPDHPNSRPLPIRPHPRPRQREHRRPASVPVVATLQARALPWRQLCLPTRVNSYPSSIRPRPPETLRASGAGGRWAMTTKRPCGWA